MAKGKRSAASAKEQQLQQRLRDYIRAKGADFLKDPNVTSVGIGRKNGDGAISLQFTVGSKVESGPEMLALGTALLPTSITLPDGTEVPTDVLERSFRPSYEITPERPINDRRRRVDPIVPGVSVSVLSPSATAGTVGLIVFDRVSGAPCILSNWHVLHGNDAQIGDRIVQPGPYDDNNAAGNLAGHLLRSHIGDAGDCALAHLKGRSFDREVYGLAVVPRRMAKVDLDDTVVKSGRTTGITYGIVRRTDVMARLDFGLPTGVQAIGGFEIQVDPDRSPPDGEISKGGDSGSAWLIADGDKATDIFAGLHFAGEVDNSADEHALACYPTSVQQKLDFVLEPPAPHGGDVALDQPAVPRAGYDPNFLGIEVPAPVLGSEHEGDALAFGEGKLIPYTHFSVCLSKSRRVARFVCWNVDGARMVVRPRRAFNIDPRIDAKHQIGNEAYRANKLDRGHIARRADLCWGSVEEAEQANRDSNFYTNIAPQHERYNQSSRKGLWGRLENLVLEQVDVQDVRVSVMGGPFLEEDDLIYRGIAVPVSYWKVVVYLALDGGLRASAFILSQSELLSDLERIDLDPFRLYQVTIADLAERSGLGFPGLSAADLMEHPELVSPAAGAERVAPRSIREIASVGDLLL